MPIGGSFGDQGKGAEEEGANLDEDGIIVGASHFCGRTGAR